MKKWLYCFQLFDTELWLTNTFKSINDRLHFFFLHIICAYCNYVWSTRKRKRNKRKQQTYDYTQAVWQEAASYNLCVFLIISWISKNQLNQLPHSWNVWTQPNQPIIIKASICKIRYDRLFCLSITETRRRNKGKNFYRTQINKSKM